MCISEHEDMHFAQSLHSGNSKFSTPDFTKVKMQQNTLETVP